LKLLYTVAARVWALVSRLVDRWLSS